MLSSLPEDFLRELKRVLGPKRVTTSPVELSLRDHDALLGFIKGRADVVVKPSSTKDVSRVVKLCYDYGIPLYVQGALTSLTGASIPFGGVVMDMSYMNKMLEVNLESGYVVVEAGIKIDEINEHLEGTGFFFPVDPGSVKSATIGGAISTNAGGMRGFKYGPIKNWVLGIEVVLPNGDVLNLGGKTLKRRQGYELMSLFIGSEGTLGIITKAVLKVIRKPEAIGRILAFFNDYVGLVDAALDIRRRFDVLTMEFMDSELVRIAADYVGLKLPKVGYMLMVDVYGAPEALDRYIREVIEVIEANGGFHIRHSTDSSEIEKLYELRRAMYPSALNLRGKLRDKMMIEDLVIPPSRLKEAFRKIYALARKYGFPVYIGGHIGDGNIHPHIFYNEDEKGDLMKFHEEIHEIALHMGGGVSAEHGIGLIKKDLLATELRYLGSERALEIMREIKKLIDPKNILNPDKVV